MLPLSLGLPALHGLAFMEYLLCSISSGCFSSPWKQGSPKANHTPGDVCTLLCFAFRFVNSLVYYGLSLNVGSFGLDIYRMQLVFGAVEIPARFGCIFLLQWFGRKKCQGFFLLLGRAVCLITSIPKGTRQVPGVQPNLPGAWSSRVPDTFLCTPFSFLL
ncbi:unnamed protein product [Lepidochelys kempii]